VGCGERRDLQSPNTKNDPTIPSSFHGQNSFMASSDLHTPDSNVAIQLGHILSVKHDRILRKASEEKRAPMGRRILKHRVLLIF